jgi:hypothetical protein
MPRWRLGLGESGPTCNVQSSDHSACSSRVIRRSSRSTDAHELYIACKRNRFGLSVSWSSRNDWRLINSEPPISIRFQKHLGVYTNATVSRREQYGRMQRRRTRLLRRSFFGFMRNSNSSPRGQRHEGLEFQEYVARSYELRNKIAARVGVRQPTHFGFVGRRTRSAGQIIWRSSGSR